MISLDGSTLEGGGQLVRVALSISAICSVPVEVHNVRANRAAHGVGRAVVRGKRTDRKDGWGKGKGEGKGRENDKRGGAKSSSSREVGGSTSGGLKESHLAALKWLAEQCDARVDGDEVGSTEITFVPNGVGKRIVSNAQDNVENSIKLEKPGSVWLIFQAIFPYLMFGNRGSSSNPTTRTLTLRGGTNVSQSMSGEYVQQVFLPVCRRIGLLHEDNDVDVEIVDRGWAGNAPHVGEVKIRVSQPQPSSARFCLPAFRVANRGEITKIAVSVVADPVAVRKQITTRIAGLVSTDPHSELSAAPVEVVVDESSHDPRRIYILLVAHTSEGWRLGCDVLGTGRKTKNAADQDKVIEELCQYVVKGLSKVIRKGGCVDEHLQDQLVVFQALAKGRSSVQTGRAGAKEGKADVEPEVKSLHDDDGEVDEMDEGCGTGTLHTRTVRWVCDKMLYKQGIKFSNDGSCQGIAWNDTDQRNDSDDETR